MCRRNSKILLLMLLSALFFAGPSSSASAHGFLVRSNPADGAILTAAPQQIEIWFSEPITVDATLIELIDAQGHKIEGIAVETLGSTLTVHVPTLALGTYGLNWQVVSGADLHETRGMVVFGIQQPVTRSLFVAEPGPPLVEVLLRWLELLALCAVIGSITVALVLGTPLTSMSTLLIRRVFRIGIGAIVLALLSKLAHFYFQMLTVGATISSKLFTTSYATTMLVALVLLLSLLLCFAVALRFPRSHLIMNIALFLTAGLCVAQTLGSHAMAFAEPSMLRIAVHSLHLMSAGIWVGGLTVLALILRHLLWQSQNITLFWHIMRRFSRVAALSLAALAITGIYTAGQQIASLDALITSRYGQFLLVKTALALLVSVLGLLNAATLHTWLKRLALRFAALVAHKRPWLHISKAGLLTYQAVPQRMRLEAIMLLGLLVIVAQISASQPPRGPAYAPQQEEQPVQLPAADTVRDMVVNMAIQPGRAGTNFVTIDAINTRRPAPAPIETVEVQLTAPDGGTALVLEAIPTPNQRYQIAGASLAVPGNWNATVTVRRTGMPNTVAHMVWPIQAPAVAPPPILLSRQPIEPVGTWLAAGFTVYLLFVLLLLKLRGRGLHISAFRSALPSKEPLHE